MMLCDIATVITYTPGSIKRSETTGRYADISKGTGSSEANQVAVATQAAGWTGTTSASGSTEYTEVNQDIWSFKVPHAVVLAETFNGYVHDETSHVKGYDSADASLYYPQGLVSANVSAITFSGTASHDVSDIANDMNNVPGSTKTSETSWRYAEISKGT